MEGRRLLLDHDHIAEGANMVKGIVRGLGRVAWVAFDQEVFIKLLERLTAFTDYVRALMNGRRIWRLEPIALRTILNLVQVKSAVTVFKHLVVTIIFLDGRVLC